MRIFALLLLIILFLSCNSRDDLIFCTDEFRTIDVTITGGMLDDFYTLRQSTGDTIRHSPNSVFQNRYPILDDNFQSIIANSQETFDFIGIINKMMVVNEEYVIKSDECHISLVSGKTEVGL